MIAGLSWGAWMLILASVGIGFGIEVTMYRRGRRTR